MNDIEIYKFLNESLNELLSKPSVKRENDGTVVEKILEYIDEFTKGYIYCIAGRPAMGKTSLVKEIIKHEKDKEFAVFSLETNKEMFMTGLENCENIVVYDSVSTIEDIEKILRNSKPDIAAIDYFQLVGVSGRNLQEIYSAASIKLNKISKELNIPIVIVSQIGRECEERIDKRPKLSDFHPVSYRAVLQDADCIMFLFNEHCYDWSKEDRQEIIIAKNRCREVGTIVVKKKRSERS